MQGRVNLLLDRMERVRKLGQQALSEFWDPAGILAFAAQRYFVGKPALAIANILNHAVLPALPCAAGLTASCLHMAAICRAAVEPAEHF